ncbi:TIGR02269 family lipoprotein [Archangium minus]|uniref:TIGR02269 family lipoprotein n=1 Tax=Archangium minus TaxID=83450 RepID=A0ABY9WNY9_9BACT|nr:TIGR02269 family lipoprotein [Archangium minus]
MPSGRFRSPRPRSPGSSSASWRCSRRSPAWNRIRRCGWRSSRPGGRYTRRLDSPTSASATCGSSRSAGASCRRGPPPRAPCPARPCTEASLSRSARPSSLHGLSLLPSIRWLALLCVLMAACATSAPGVREDDETPDAVSSWEEARADPSCVVPLCDEARCALWRCRDLVEVDDAPAPAVVLTRGPMPQAMRPPLVGSPSRWWGRTLATPTYEEPVFEIPWHNWKSREQGTLQPRHPLACMLPPEPLEKHHIFPQARDLAEWFDTKGINIHAFTISLPRSFHRRLHSGGPKGGQWNEAWRQFQEQNQGASTKEIWKFAFELMFLFKVNGSFVPYCQD